MDMFLYSAQQSWNNGKEFLLFEIAAAADDDFVNVM